MKVQVTLGEKRPAFGGAFESSIEKLNRITNQSNEWDALGTFSVEGSPGNRRLSRNSPGNGEHVVIQGDTFGLYMRDKEIEKALRLLCEVLESLAKY